MKTSMLFLVLVMSVSRAAIAEASSNFTTIIGTPKAKVETHADSTKRSKLNAQQGVEYHMEIVRQGGEFIWISREGKTLTHSISGAYDNFVNPEGAGYVKVMMLQGECEYMEHVNLQLSTITYYGECDVRRH